MVARPPGHERTSRAVTDSRPRTPESRAGTELWAATPDWARPPDSRAGSRGARADSMAAAPRRPDGRTTGRGLHLAGLTAGRRAVGCTSPWKMVGLTGSGSGAAQRCWGDLALALHSTAATCGRRATCGSRPLESGTIRCRAREGGWALEED